MSQATQADTAENYLGSTVNAPQGRWQKNQDIHWYSRDVQQSEEEAAAQRRAEIRQLKEAEEEALAIALGHKPPTKEGEEGTGANAVEVKRDPEVDKEERRREKQSVCQPLT